MIIPHTKDGSTRPVRIDQTKIEADEFSSQEYLGRRIRGATDGEIRSVWPIRSRMAESTSGGRSEAEWPNQHRAVAEADRPTTTEGKRPNQHQTIRSHIGRSPKPSDRPDDRPRPNPGRGQTAESRRLKPTPGNNRHAVAHASGY